MISGDFNINLLELENRTKYQEFFDTFVTKGFFPRIVHPTRFSKKRGTLIDQIFSNLPLNPKTLLSGLIHTSLSDHFPYFTSFTIPSRAKPVRPKHVKINRYDKDSIERFSNDLSESIGQQNFNNDLFVDPNQTYNMIEECIKQASEKHLQPKIVRFQRRKHKLNPWITNGILRSIAHKDYLYKQLHKTNRNSLEYNTLETNLRTYQAILRKNIRIAKMNYYGNTFEKYANDIKNTWKKINEVLNKCSNKKEFPDYFIIDDTKTQDKSNIANSFNTYFANIGPELSSKITSDSTNTINSYMKDRIVSSFNFSTVTAAEVIKITMKLK